MSLLHRPTLIAQNQLQNRPAQQRGKFLYSTTIDVSSKRTLQLRVQVTPVHNFPWLSALMNFADMASASFCVYMCVCLYGGFRYTACKCKAHAPYYNALCECLALPYLSTLSHKQHHFRNNAAEPKMRV